MLATMKKFFRRINSQVMNLIKEDGFFFVVLTILNSSIIFFPGDIQVLAVSFWLGAFALFLLAAAIHLLPLKIRRLIQTALIILFVLLFVADIFLLQKFDVPMHIEVVQILLATNFAEATDFLQSNALNFKVLGSLAAFIFLLAALSLGLKKFFATRSEERLKRLSTELMIIFFLPAVFCTYFTFASEINVFDSLSAKTTLGRFVKDTFFVVKNYPISGDEKVFSEMDKHLETEKILADDSNIPFVIFVLGESTDRNHMQLYGYRLPTTPRLNARYERGEIFRFTDTIACANNTASAMAKIFTFAEKDEPQNDWYLKANLFDILRRTNYHTVWLSCQSPRGIFGNFGKYYSSRCDEKFFVKPQSEFYDTAEFDEVLLPVLDKFLAASTAEKNFYVIHIYGTHAPFTDRYPAEFEKFSASDINKTEESWRQGTAEYDNAVLYNDFVVDEIIKRFENKNAVLIYISDHGEEVYDGRDFAWHSLEEDGNVHMIEIPALVWASKSFRERYPEKISALTAALDRPYRTDYLIHTLLDFMDIRTTSFDESKSIINKNFEERPRIYNGVPYMK